MPQNAAADTDTANAATDAGELNAVILLKGAVDIISDGESVRFNTTGTPVMTKDGTGDGLLASDPLPEIARVMKEETG